ncbi:Zinc finger BED domain-containing protein 1, partial [Mortierella antarctica]
MEYCSVTSDVWSSRTSRPFISVTLHWLTEAYQLQCVVIALEPFDHPHTGECTKAAIVNILHAWGLWESESNNRVVGIATDNASTLKKAIGLMQPQGKRDYLTTVVYSPRVSLID